MTYAPLALARPPAGPKCAIMALMARALLLLVAVSGGEAAMAAPVRAAPALRLRIVQPVPGGVVNGAAFSVQLAVEGAGLDSAATRWPPPGTFHITLDGVDVLQTPELRFTLMGVPAGAHRLGATLAGATGGPLVAAEVPFTAQAVAPPAGASWVLAGAVAAVGAGILGLLVWLWLAWVRPQRAELLYDPPPSPDGPSDAAGN